MALALTRAVAIVGLLFAVGAFAWRWRGLRRMPLAADRTPSKGAAGPGVVYAFTQGMAPWAKESTRRHPLAYLRGVAFHVGIASGGIALALIPLWPGMPVIALRLLAVAAALGAACGLLGLLARLLEPDLRALSTPDDYASVAVVTSFQAATAIAIVTPAWLAAAYLLAGLTLLYAPLGKIRHCIYFFFSRRFFGVFLGRRGLLHPERAR